MLKQQRIISDALLIISKNYKKLMKKIASLGVLMNILAQANI